MLRKFLRLPFPFVSVKKNFEGSVKFPFPLIALCFRVTPYCNLQPNQTTKKITNLMRQHRLQLTNSSLQIVEVNVLLSFASTCLATTVDSGVGNWWFTLHIRAVHSFVPVVTTHIAAPLKLCSSIGTNLLCFAPYLTAIGTSTYYLDPRFSV